MQLSCRLTRQPMGVILLDNRRKKEVIMEIMPHLQIRDDLGVHYAILPGDPARVDRIAEQLTDVEELAYNREFKSVRGLYKDVPVLAVSTGIGGPSACIAVEELARAGVTHMVRIGSGGALQPGIHLGDLVMVQGAVRSDGASKMYIDPVYPAVPDFDLLTACVTAARQDQLSYHVGLCRSHDSFYTDQEDEMRTKWTKSGIMVSDMETAALFVVGRLRGVHTASILNTVVEYKDDLEQNISNYADGASRTMQGEWNEIHTALEACYIVSSAE